jgi:hypothetical protein
MASAMHATCFHCPLCNEDFCDFAAFDNPAHRCVMMTDTPGVAEKIITARASQRARERRAAARYIALFASPDATRI